MFDTVTHDVNGDYNNSTGEFTVPSDGVYTISSAVQPRHATDTNGITRTQLSIFIDGVVTYIPYDVYLTETGGLRRNKAQGSVTVPLTQGQVVTIRVYCAITPGTWYAEGGQPHTFFSILKISDL